MALQTASILCNIFLLANRKFEPLQIESDALKPRQTKKGQKPVIQLVAADPPSSLPENMEGPKEADKSKVQADILVELPGPVPPAVPHLDDLVVSKATGVPAARYPVRQARALNQKENRSL